jgi:hypothetical protein
MLLIVILLKPFVIYINEIRPLFMLLKPFIFMPFRYPYYFCYILFIVLAEPWELCIKL